MNAESKKVTAQCSAEKLYNFSCDFRNFQRFLPPQIEDFQAGQETCTFKVAGFMQLSLQYVERCPHTLVAVGPATGSSTPVAFRLALLITPADDMHCDVVVRAEMDGNPMMAMMLKPKLRPALDKIAEQIQYYSAGI
ncbi:MAG: hypothetical protein IJR26_03845 [Bacteroidales bacterium]|nr:hypothetical protein [Bacteroidales bacterium]